MKRIIKISNQNIFKEKEAQSSFLPLDEGEGTFIARMELDKKEEEYIYPKDYYAIYSTSDYAYEVEIPEDFPNRFSASGVLKLPDNVSSKEELDELKLKLRNLHGSEDAGRTFVIPFLPSEPIPNNIFESFELQNIDKLFTLQKSEAQASIQKYNI